MSHPVIERSECSACGICLEVCPSGAIDILGEYASVVNEEACTACGDCMEECPMGAIVDIEED